MIIFEFNTVNIYGNKGRAWLDRLPEHIQQISSKFNLHDLEPLPNLTYNYVMSGFQGDNPIILKLASDSEALKREAVTLKCCAKYGAAKVIAEGNGMLLLERAVPGISLKSYFPDKDTISIEIICKVMERLHQAKFSKCHNFLHIKDWLSALDKDWNLPTYYLQKARKLRDKLLQPAEPDVLLHGDLHHDNILRNGNSWMVIDPKGVIGPSAYETTAFIRNPIPDLLAYKNAEQIIQNRISTFANHLDVSSTTIAEWCFVQSVLSWVWKLEDSYSETLARSNDCSTSYFPQITMVFHNLV